jgi:hypothetical protein
VKESDALDAAISVSLLLPLPGDAMFVGANFAVSPFGRPLTASAIGDLNPFAALVLKENFVALPAVTVAFAEFAVSANVGTATVKLNACVLVSPPPTPFNVSVEPPPAAEEAALSVSVLVPLPGDAMLAGAKLAVTLIGCPLTDNVMADWNPLTAAVET